MTPRALFLIELIDKLGVPLMRAAGKADGEKNSAETLAGLLSSSVKLGLSVTDKMGLHEEDGDVDSVRVALSAAAAQMVADHYQKSGNIPLDEDHTQMSKSVDTLITFAENFTASKDHTARLKNLGTDKIIFDAAQSQVFYLSAMQPVLGAVSTFSFGQSAAQLLPDIAEKLQTRAGALREALSGTGADAGEEKFTELMILHALARIYTDVHVRKTGELEKAGADSAITMDDVWSDFDTQITMLETLLNVALPGGEQEVPAAPAPVSEPPPQEEAPPPAQEAAPPPQEPATPPPTEEPQAAPTDAPADTPSNPMGFFTKKEDDAPAETPAAAPPTETPPAEPAAQTPPPPPPPPPPASEPAAAPAENTPEDKPQGDPGNPMSFFKKPEGEEE